jgi:hypothetical protein
MTFKFLNFKFSFSFRLLEKYLYVLSIRKVNIQMSKMFTFFLSIL